MRDISHEAGGIFAVRECCSAAIPGAADAPVVPFLVESDTIFTIYITSTVNMD